MIIISRQSTAVKRDLNDVVSAAEDKLARIIEREGDANGQRRTPGYLMQLVHEELIRRAATDYCMAHYRG